VSGSSDIESGLVARIVELRAARGLKQKELAEALGLDPSSVSRIEKGERAVSVAELVQMADVLGVRVEELLAVPNQPSGVLLRAPAGASPALESSLDLFRDVIHDFFGAQAAVQ
jgi:transcriptional regulator with XRE-family HTH domain